LKVGKFSHGGWSCNEAHSLGSCGILALTECMLGLQSILPSMDLKLIYPWWYKLCGSWLSSVFSLWDVILIIAPCML
jgi:hypothetical protein